MFKSKFLFIFLLVVPLALAACGDDDDEEEAERARLQSLIATEQEKGAALALKVEEDTLAAANRAADEAKLAAAAALTALYDANAAYQTALDDGADAAEVKRLAAEAVAAKLLADETARIAAAAEAVRSAQEFAALDAAETLAEETAKSKADAEQASLDEIARLERVHSGTHDPDHDPALHDAVSAAQVVFDSAEVVQKAVAGIYYNAAVDEVAAYKVEREANQAVLDAQTVRDQAVVDDTAANIAITDAQAAFDATDSGDQAAIEAAQLVLDNAITAQFLTLQALLVWTAFFNAASQAHIAADDAYAVVEDALRLAMQELDKADQTLVDAQSFLDSALLALNG